MARLQAANAADKANLNAIAQLLLAGKAKSAANRFVAWKAADKRLQD
jgi:hypothetical protein